MARQTLSVAANPGLTEQVDSSDSPQELPDSVKYEGGSPDDNKRAKTVIITVENNSIRVAFNTNPTQDGGTGLGHVLDAKDQIELNSWSEIDNFQFISKVGGAHGTLQTTPGY